jgi:hypothetical protein
MMTDTRPGLAARPWDPRAEDYSLTATLEAYEVQELDPRQVARLLADEFRRSRPRSAPSAQPGAAA